MLPRPHVEDITQLLEAHGRHAREVVGRVVGDGRARRFGHEEEDEDEGEGVEAREEEEEAEMPDFRYGQRGDYEGEEAGLGDVLILEPDVR